MWHVLPDQNQAEEHGPAANGQRSLYGAEQVRPAHTAGSDPRLQRHDHPGIHKLSPCPALEGLPDCLGSFRGTLFCNTEMVFLLLASVLADCLAWLSYVDRGAS